MATMTIAQALASTATGIIIADTPSNIAYAVSNSLLQGRVSEYTLNANGASDAHDATVLATLGSQFSVAGFHYVVRDSFAALSDPSNAAGLNVGTSIAVFDTAATLLAEVNSSIVKRAGSVLMSNSASLSLAQLVSLESEPAFSVLPGQSITLADSAGNLGALTPAEARNAIHAYTVTVNSTVTIQVALSLFALPQFSIAPGVTLTVTGNAAAMTAATAMANLQHFGALSTIVVNVADTLANLSAAAGSLNTLSQSVASLTSTMNDSETMSAAQLTEIAVPPHFSVAPGNVLTLSDTIANLVAISPSVAALAQVTNLSLNDVATMAQLAVLVTRPGFNGTSPHGVTLADTLANLSHLAGAELHAFSAITVIDTVANFVAVNAVPAGTSAIRPTLDGGSYTIAQGAALLALAPSVTLVPSGSNTALQIADTIQDILAGGATIAALSADGPVSVTATDTNSTVTASAAIGLLALSGFNAAAYNLSIADSGSALSAVASQIFGKGFTSITVTSGIFVGTEAQLLDTTLHFSGGQSGSLITLAALPAAAQLGTNTTASAAQLVSLALLPGFSVGSGVTLTLRDSMFNLVNTAHLVSTYATVVQVTDSETMTAAAAEQLALIRAAVGAGNFSLGGNVISISDDGANIANAANAGGVALAGSVVLSVGSIITAAQAATLVGVGETFSPNGNILVILDTASNLANLAGATTTINGWHAQVQLSADATLTVAGAQPLLLFSSFTIGTHHLTISDTASNLLAGGAASALALATAVTLSQPATVTVASAVTLAAMHGFSTGSQALTIADTPAHLAAMSPSIALLATGESITALTGSNAADFTISATQLAALQALSHLSTAGFSSTITVSDSASALAGLAASFVSPPAGSLMTHVVPVLSGNATVTAGVATTLAGLPGFGLGGHTLSVQDTPTTLLSAGATAGIAIATSTGISAPAAVTVATANALALLHGFGPDSNALTVIDTPAALLTLSAGAQSVVTGEQVAPLTGSNSAAFTLNAAQFTALAAIPHMSFSGPITISDTATNLIALQTAIASASSGSALQLASAVSFSTLSANANVSVLQLGSLTALPGFSLGGHSLTVTDTPSSILAVPSSEDPFVSGVTLAANSGPWVVSTAQADILATIPNLNVGPGITVSDNVGNLLASNNTVGLSIAGSVTLSADATVTAAQAISLHHITGFTPGTHHLTISNGGTGLATLDAGTAAMATSILESGNAILTLAQYQVILGLPHFSLNGNVLAVADTAANLLTLATLNLSLVSSTALSTAATVTADQAETLSMLPNFSAAAGLSIVDTAADLLRVSSGVVPADLAGELLASSVTLSANATVTAAQAEELAQLGSRFSKGGHTLTITDTAAALVSPANAQGLSLASSVTLAGPEPGISAATATELAGISGFSKTGTPITVSDTATNLLFAGNAAGIALADHVQLGTAASMTAASAEALIGLANYQANVSAPLTVADTLENLLALHTTALANNNALLQATPIGLSENTVATVAQVTALEALSQYALTGHHFSLNGFTLTIFDSARNIAAYTPDAITIPTAYDMVGDGTVTAAQADIFATRGVVIGTNLLTVADTPTALLSGANASGIALAGALTLSGNATASAAQAVSLFGNALFSTGGHELTVQDTAETLIGLSHGIDMQVATLALIASQTVSVATLLGVAELGSQFSLAGHTLTVADNATNLATLNSLETALVASEHLNTAASVNAATAEKLAALPNFVDDATLTIVDTAANLTALSAAARAIGTHELLTPGSSITLTVAQAQALAALPAFSNSGATITVVDTLANLSATGWQSVATSYDVTDSAANLVANASGSLIAHAAAVTLLGDSVIDTTEIDTLASMAHFSRGTSALVVTDSPDLIAAHAASILAVASDARISSSTPIDAAQAEELVGLANSSELTFSGSNHLVVSDNFANLANVNNAGGVALAFTLTITDTAANLVLATAHNWRGASPFYVLAGNDTVTGAQATALAGLTTHFSTAGHTLVMSDTAAGVVANGAALGELGIDAQVVDMVAGIDGNVGGLVALGSSLRSVTPTNGTGISAAAAGDMHAIAGVLAGSPLTVTDTSSNIVANSTPLLQLGAHLGSITIADSSPATAAVAVGLLPLVSEIAPSNVVNVTDTGATLANDASSLAALGSVLGVVRVSDGPAIDAANAAELVPIDANLSGTTALDVTDTAADIVAVSAGLAAMRTAGFIHSITTSPETAADIAANASALHALSATVTIADTAAHIVANLNALAAFPSLFGTITLSDATTPTIDVSVAQLGADAAVLAAIGSAYNLTVNDSAINIQNDITSVSSTILNTPFGVTAIHATDSGPLSLTETQVLATGIDDGAGSVMQRFSGAPLLVTNVLVNDIPLIVGLDVAPNSIMVSDSASQIEADLTSGASVMVSDRTLITHITANDAGTISLTLAQVDAAHVDDGAGSVFAKMSGAQLTITGVTVAQIAGVATLPVAPNTIDVSDTAGLIQADLTAGTSHILTNLTKIGTIDANDAGTITLTPTQIEAAGVDDTAHSALAKMTGENLVVTNAGVGDLTTLASLDVPPAAIFISDTATHVQNDLRAGGTSHILANLHLIQSITVQPSGTISLTESQVRHAGVDDSGTSALGIMVGATLVVTGVAVGDIGTVLSLSVPPATISVSDSASAIQADMTGGSSAILANLGSITGIAISDSGTITLNVAQITAAGIDDGGGSVLSELTGGTVAVSGALVADIATLIALPVRPSSIGLSDSAADVQSDLMSGSSAIMAHLGLISAIAFNDGGTPAFTLSLSVLQADHAAIALITTQYALGVSDSAANIQTDLRLATPYLTTHIGAIASINVNDSGTITLTAAQVLRTHVDDGAGSVFSELTGGALVVTGVALSQVNTILNLGFPPTSITITDSTTNIQSDLTGGSSIILANIAAITGVNVDDGGPISLTETEIQSPHMDDGAGSVMSMLTGTSVIVTNVPITDISAMLALPVVPTSIAVSDTGSNIAGDLSGGSSTLVSLRSHISSIIDSDNATISLTAAQAEAAHVDDGAGSVFAKLTGGSLTITGALIADIVPLEALGVPPSTIAISDSAAHIQTDLASGSSHILAHLNAISGIVVNDAGTITLTMAQVQATHVDDGAGSAFSLLSGGNLIVTGVSTAQIPTILGLAFPPISITVSDTASHIQQDLTGGSSTILSNLASITHITASDAGTITLTEAQILATGVDDGGGSALSLLSGGTVDVTGVAVGDVDMIMSLGAPPSSITVVGLAADITSDLTGGSSALLAHRTAITSITVTDSGVISLTVAEATAAHVDSGAGSVLGKIVGGTLTVTGAAVGDISTLAALTLAPTGMSISDIAANIQSDLRLATPTLVTNLALISSITVSDSGTISLTEAQLRATHVDDTSGSVFGIMTGETLAVTNVLTADIRTVDALFVSPSSFAISDTAAGIQADLTSGSSAILAFLGAIPTITITSGTLTLTEDQVRAVSVDDGAGSALSKMTGLTLAVIDVLAADVSTVLSLGVPPSSIAVSDSAADIQADLTGGASELVPNRAVITGITVTDNGAISLTVAQVEAAGVDDGAGSVFSLISGGSLTITGALVSDINTLAALSVRPTEVDVSDTAANIQADLTAGAGSHILSHPGLIGAIAVNDAGTITLTETQLRTAGVDDGIHSALAKTTGGTIAVTGVLAADVNLVAHLRVPPSEIAVTDTAAHLQSDLTSGSSGILANLSAITSITVSPSGTISLTESQVQVAGVDDSGSSALALMTGLTLDVNHVLAADVGTMMTTLSVQPATIEVTDTAAHVQADLASGTSHILAWIANVTAIAVVPSGTITLTYSQMLAGGLDDGAGSALSKMTGETLVISQVTVSQIAGALGFAVPPSSIEVADTAANIVADLTGGSSVIAANSSAISSVAPTDGTLSVADATALYNACLGVVPLDESGLTITGTSSQLLTAETTVPAMLADAEHVVMTDNPVGLTAAQATTLSGILGGTLAHAQTLGVVDTATNLLNSSNAAGIALATSVALNAPTTTDAGTATSLAELHSFNAGAQPITIQDTVANLLNSANEAGIGIATTVSPNSDLTGANAVSTTTLAQLAALHDFATGGHNITVAGNAAAIAGLTQTQLGFTSLAAVTDTSANVLSQLGALQSNVAGQSHAMSISLTDAVSGTIAIVVNAATYAADATTLDDIVGKTGVVEVTGGAVALAAVATQLANDPVVGDVEVTDTSTNILANLTALNSIGSKFSSATVTDSPLSAAAVSSLLTIPHLSATGLTISDTGSQIAAAIQANGAAGVTFMTSPHVTVELSGDSVVTASQALSLQSLPGLVKGSFTLSVWDTASHLTDSADGFLAAVKAAGIDVVYLKTSGGTATISASTAVALFGIHTLTKNNPDSSTNILTVQDTAAHLESAFSSLISPPTPIDHIVVSSSATVTDAVFADLLTLGATMAGGANLTVRDTAANIIAHAASQIAGTPSIVPATWAISASASVSTVGAALLGGLPISAGAFTLTLNDTGVAVTVQQANNLGNLGATLHLNGSQIDVVGNVSDMAPLSGSARAIVAPQITDTFANVAGLTLGDGLLGGTITVTDSETPTVAQANAFLAILKVGSNGGIPAANISFGGHKEAVTDTLANIQTMTGSSGWTSNNSVHADFTLVVADTVANLINPANTTALAGMAGTTLSSNQTVSAAQAESLATLESTINFSRGAFTVTIQDTAANILNVLNVDGETLAASWQLAGDDTVVAADAETLLTASKFDTNGHILTVSDFSSNLLDGILSGDISGYAHAANVHVELSDAEALDASTAAALVALPGFTNNGNLSIQDSSDYLLNPANHAAEVLATSVTLVGDETVSAATAARLAGLPNFVLGSNHLDLASNDFADAPTLAALADFGSGFSSNGNTLTMTQDALTLTPAEYGNLQSDNVVLNGHALSALATDVLVTSSAGTVHVSGNGVSGATLNVYSSSGSLLSQTPGAAASFTANASEGAIGNGVVVTETVGASAATSESAPIIALESTVITTAATADGATFLGSGSVQVSGGNFVNVYTTATAPANPANPDLVYDPTHFTLSLEIGSHAPVVLVTLGAATHPTAILPSEIHIQHFT